MHIGWVLSGEQVLVCGLADGSRRVAVEKIMTGLIRDWLSSLRMAAAEVLPVRVTEFEYP